MTLVGTDCLGTFIFLLITLEMRNYPDRHRGRRSPPLAAAPQHLERGSNPGTVGYHSVEKNASPWAWWRRGITAWKSQSLSLGCRASLDHNQHWCIEPLLTRTYADMIPNASLYFTLFLRNQTKITAVDFAYLFRGLFLPALTNLD